MKKRWIAISAFLFFLCLPSCADYRNSGSSPACPVLSSEIDESSATVRELMEYDMTSYMNACGFSCRADRYFGRYNGYYSAAYDLNSSDFGSTKGHPKKWFVGGDAYYYGEVPILAQNHDSFNTWSGSPQYLWKDRKISTLKEAFDENGISMGDILEMALLSLSYSQGGSGYFLPDSSEMDAQYSTLVSIEEPDFPWVVETPTTLREKICAEYAARYASFTNRYFARLNPTERANESAKPRTWIEKYLGNIGDAYVLEMGILGYPKELGKSFCSRDADRLFDLWEGHNDQMEISYPLVIYQKGCFYGFTIAFLNNPTSHVVMGDVFSCEKKDLEEWEVQSEFDDSFLDAPLS